MLEIIKKNPHAFRKSIDGSTKVHHETPKVRPYENSLVQDFCKACGLVTSFGKPCICSRSLDENDHPEDELLRNKSQAIQGKKKRFKATMPMRQNDDETVQPPFFLETISAIPAPQTRGGSDQSPTNLDVSDLSHLARNIANGESSEDRNIKQLVQKTFDVMDKVLTAGIPNSALPQKRSMHSILYPASLAQQILTNVSAQVNHLLHCADAAETRVRSAAEEQRSKLKTPPYKNGKIIPIGTTFRKHFDSLGEFEGVVVSLPTSSNPSYEVEYEDGGSESLSYESLVALLGPEIESEATVETQPTDDEESESHNLLEQQIQCAREDAIEEACKQLLSGDKVE